MARVSKLLLDDFDMLSRYLEGKAVKKILNCTETTITLLMEDGIIVDFSHLEDEIIFDISLPASFSSN